MNRDATADAGGGDDDLPGTPMYTQNTACDDLSTCLCTQYDNNLPISQDTASTPTGRDKYTDRTCSDLTVCTDDEYESVYPTKLMGRTGRPDDFVYTSDRVCAKFSDYNGNVAGSGGFLPDTATAGGRRDDVPCTSTDNVAGECNDGGVCDICSDPAQTTIGTCTGTWYPCGANVCPWGSDGPDCPARTKPGVCDYCSNAEHTTSGTCTGADTWFPCTGAWPAGDRRPNLADDCLPFYHQSDGTASGRWVGQYWNKATVRATLPGAGTPQHGLSSNKMALIASDCGTTRSPSIKWP